MAFLTGAEFPLRELVRIARAPIGGWRPRRAVRPTSCYGCLWFHGMQRRPGAMTLTCRSAVSESFPERHTPAIERSNQLRLRRRSNARRCYGRWARIGIAATTVEKNALLTGS